jgi:hypothetical protein
VSEVAGLTVVALSDEQAAQEGKRCQVSELPGADLDDLISVLRYDDEWRSYIKRLCGNCPQRLDGELCTNMSWAQIDNADERFILCDDERPKVAIVRQDNATIGVRDTQHGQIALSERFFLHNGADVVSLLPQVGHDIRMNVFIGQQWEIQRIHITTSATKMLSFLRKRAA